MRPSVRDNEDCEDDDFLEHDGLPLPAVDLNVATLPPAPRSATDLEADLSPPQASMSVSPSASAASWARRL